MERSSEKNEFMLDEMFHWNITSKGLFQSPGWNKVST